jgi:hypothetical protein
MVCCAICGLTKLNHQRKHFRKLISLYNNANTNEFGCTLYGITNCLLSDYTTTSNGKEIYICSKCHIERDAPTYVKYVVFQSPTYMKAFFSQHPFYIQLFSFLNIGLHIQIFFWGFSIGEIIDSSLLNSPLLSWDDILNKKISHQNVINKNKFSKYEK